MSYVWSLSVFQCQQPPETLPLATASDIWPFDLSGTKCTREPLLNTLGSPDSVCLSAVSLSNYTFRIGTDKSYTCICLIKGTIAFFQGKQLMWVEVFTGKKEMIKTTKNCRYSFVSV